jgi:hypothetical protein
VSVPAEETAHAALSYPAPSRRGLRIFASDPMVARLSGSETVTLSVPYEPLAPGPTGELVQVVDYDGAADRFYEPVDLDDPRLLLQDGLAPSERDPRFHQQMVYAVVSALLENFERGLGQRFRWRGRDRLRAFPHAFHGANARFEPDLDGSLQFGYFRADERDPGRNLPGQHVFTCLSHDIIVHEASHALVHRQRDYYKEATNVDVYAFHEGFADLVALFQHFTLPDLVDRYVAQTRTDLTQPTPLVELARQFGESSGRGKALRSAIGEEPDPTALSRTFEPHKRGAILVASVFDAFVASYRDATADLIRIATSGSGVLPEGALPPDLVRRVSAEARATAQRLLTMCIRAFQYLPPVDVTFSDFLRSIVTGDRDLYPADASGLRTNLIEGFRKRGIYPQGVGSLGEDSLPWPECEGVPDLPPNLVHAMLLQTAVDFLPTRGAGQPTVGPTMSTEARARALGGWARQNVQALGLSAELPVQVDGFHAVFRVGAGGAPRADIIARFVQSLPRRDQRSVGGRLGGVPLRGGSTVVADATGRVRFVVTRPVPTLDRRDGAGEPGALRMRDIEDFVATFDGYDAMGPWLDRAERIPQTLNFARIDG